MSAEPTRPRVAAVLLAAGESRRMQGIDKRTLMLDGVPLVRRWFDVFSAAGIQEVVVVLGPDSEPIQALLAGVDARRVCNPDPSRGQHSSVLAGLAALPAGVDAAMVVLVDLILIEAADLRTLIAAFSARPGGTCAVVPTYAGQRGNPVIVTGAAAAAAVMANRQDGLRGYLQAQPGRVHHWLADNDHFIVDLDTQADIARLESRLGRPLMRP